MDPELESLPRGETVRRPRLELRTDRSLLPPLLDDESLSEEDTERDDDDEQLLTDEEDRPILPSGGRGRSGGGNLTLFFSTKASLHLRDSVFSIGGYDELLLLSLQPFATTLLFSGMANSGSSILGGDDDDCDDDSFVGGVRSLPRIGDSTVDRDRWTIQNIIW
eukprot:CAMPEP_0196183346 /NCGR_PEP_ID=MMETSP0911-20130528/31515_1 /TAXON_ID=49265 /ORGANISM="Thalassiosira rotula, Strain GSO102" /LENGTH=163 /DNA_ID=CAMNT_0041453249 /DNA_START=32 /DNA_END=524 /DNA_ORIENTATION=+